MSLSPSADDTSRELAARIGRLLDAGVSLESPSARDALDDDVVRTLLTYRREHTLPEPSDAASERLWTRIEGEIAKEETRRSIRRTQREAREARRPARILPLRTAWAVAAAVVVAVSGILWWTLSVTGPDARLVASAEQQITTYRTPDGSVVRLRPNSRLHRVATDEATRFRLTGEALFEVTERTDAPFEVEANGAVVRVLGTRFTVRTWTPDPEVFLDAGRVELRSPASGASAVLAPGQRGAVGDDGSVTTSEADAAAFTGWLERQMVFESRPARAVADELEQHYGVTLRLPASVAQQTLSGRVLLDDREQSLADLGAVLGGRFERVDDRTFRFTPTAN